MDCNQKKATDGTVIEGRQHVRIKPSEMNPITIRFALPDSDAVDVAAMDISSGGISFLVADGLRDFHTDDWLYLDIDLPMHGNVHALAVVKYTVCLPHMTRIGVQFSQMSEAAHRSVVEYLKASAGQTQETSPAL